MPPSSSASTTARTADRLDARIGLAGKPATINEKVEIVVTQDSTIKDSTIKDSTIKDSSDYWKRARVELRAAGFEPDRAIATNAVVTIASAYTNAHRTRTCQGHAS